MNRKMIKGKNIKTKLWISFKQHKAQLQLTQLACTTNTQHRKCCGTRQNAREHKGKHADSSRNIKTWQHLTETPKQPPKSKA